MARVKGEEVRSWTNFPSITLPELRHSTTRLSPQTRQIPPMRAGGDGGTPGTRYHERAWRVVMQQRETKAEHTTRTTRSNSGCWGVSPRSGEPTSRKKGEGTREEMFMTWIHVARAPVGSPVSLAGEEELWREC